MGFAVPPPSPAQRVDRSAPGPSPPRALALAERQLVLDRLNAERFRDKAPAKVYATAEAIERLKQESKKTNAILHVTC